MSKTVGQAIVEARTRKGIRAVEIATALGFSGAWMSEIENSKRKSEVDAETVVRIADYLDDRSILTVYLENNPVYRSIIPKIFPDLNNIRRDPAIIFNRLGREMAEGKDACDILAEIFSNANPLTTPRFEEVFRAQMEQIIDVKRGVEILELQLLVAQVMSENLQKEIYQQQEEKCIRKGHHCPEVAA